MPIYNGIEFIDESVKSIIAQTYTKWELIIGINGHEPGSYVYRVAKEYENFVPGKIRVVDLYPVKGKSNALNEMVKLCQYDHVALLDVDDIWFPSKLEIQSVYVDLNYDVVGTRCVYFGDIKNVIPHIPVGDISQFDFRLVNPIINSSCIVRKTLCHWNENGIEDYDLWLRLRYRQEDKPIKFMNCVDVLVKHRIHKSSAFNSNGKNQKSVPELLAQYQSNT